MKYNIKNLTILANEPNSILSNYNIKKQARKLKLTEDEFNDLDLDLIHYEYYRDRNQIIMDLASIILEEREKSNELKKKIIRIAKENVSDITEIFNDAKSFITESTI